MERWLKLFQAAGEGDVPQVRDLVARGADVKERGADGWTLLHVAAMNGHVEVATQRCMRIVTPGFGTARQKVVLE
jgi:ankyrin repeat protein